MHSAPPAEPSAPSRIEQVATIRPDADWSRLLAAGDGATIFQSPEWIGTWTEHFLPRDTAQLTRVACTVTGTPVAQAWVYRYSDDGNDRWLLVGSGNTDTLDPLIDPHRAAHAAEQLFDGLRRLALQAPVELLQLSASSPLVAHARRAGCTITAAEPCLVVDVQRAGGFEATVQPGLARNIAYARRRLGREGTWSIADATRDTLPIMLERLFELHAARWHARGQNGVLADPRVRSFLHCVAARLLGRGLILRALQLDGQIIACHYGFRTRDREFYYIGGFDPAFAHLSPGIVLLADALDRARADGLHWLDLLRGREPYKYEWGAHEQPHVRALIV